MIVKAAKELEFIFFHKREIKRRQWNRKAGKSMLRSENIFDTISIGALPQSNMETKILSRSATSIYIAQRESHELW